MLRKVFIILAILALATGSAYAQGKTNLSGSYTFDEAKSDPAPAPPAGGGGGGGGRGGGRGGQVASALVIKQSPTEISIERTTARGAQPAVAYKVGGETVVPGGRGEAKATTKWEGEKLVIDSTQSMGDMTITTKEVYSLSGNVLTVERTTTTPNGTQTRKLIYNKTT